MAPEDGPAPAPDEPSVSAAVQADQAMAAELAQWKDKALRARADYDNLQRRVQRDAALERDRAKARVLEHFIPLNELAQMAAHQAQAHPGPVSEGVTLLAREFARMLEREGLTPIGAVGEAFNAAHHEAVATEPADGIAPGAVARVVQVGYRLGDKVLRHAKVTVAAADAEAPQG